MSLKEDIADRADIVRLVDAFYERVRVDDLLSPVFAHVNWTAHLPVMHNFWSSLVFGDGSYNGNPFARHKDLAIGAVHFERWLFLFTQTIDELFEGPRASEVKQRASNIAGVFKYKMGLG